MISFLVQFVRQHFLIICCCVVTAVVWPNLRTHLISDKQPLPAASKSEPAIRVLTADELAKFDGIQNEKLYLSILGMVFDVSKGAKHYQAGASYNYFVGKDASVAFITGDFEKSDDSDYEVDDVLKHLKAQEIYSIQQWAQFYNKDYSFVGRLSGRFYDENGAKTAYTVEVERQIELAIAENERQKELKNQYPPCNIDWKQETGTRVWCTEQSGGIDRDWSGVPRKFFDAGKSDFRCVCVPDDRLNDARLKEYDDCDAAASTCFYRVEATD